MYESFLRPLLFQLSADQSHELARIALRWPALWTLLARGGRVADPRLATQVAGVECANPIGLAPGFDKNAELIQSLSRLGFGYIVVGSITTAPREGNRFPRLVRYVERQSIANSMGMPNVGLAQAISNLQRLERSDYPVFASVAGFSVEELLQAAHTVAPYVAAIEIGLVCPNTTESERMDELRIFISLVEALTSVAARLRKPIFIKLPPHHTDVDRQRVFSMLDACLRVGIQGVSVSGSRPVVEPGLGMGKGSLAGRDVFEDALRITREIADYVHGALTIRSAGGVFSGADALQMLEAGASAVEVYSAFVFRGWAVAGNINRELIDALHNHGLSSVSQLFSARRPRLVEHR